MKRWNLLVVLFLFGQIVFAQPADIQFEHYGTSDGLANMAVQDIYQDRLGFLWIATWDGLSFYDGQKFTNYNRIPFDTTSISENDIKSITEDGDGNIWVATNHGINRFSRNTGSFTRFLPGPDPTKIPKRFGAKVFFDGDLWVGLNSSRFLNRYDQDCNGFDKIEKESKDPIIEIAAWDKYLLLGGRKRLMLFDKVKRTEVEIKRVLPGLENVTDVWIEQILVSKNEIIWIASQSGLYRYQIEKQELSYFNHKDGLNHPVILSLAEDQTGGIWVGTYQGLNYVNSDGEVMASYRANPDNPASLNDNFIRSLLIDRSENLWVGTARGGLQKARLNLSKRFSSYNNTLFGEPNLSLYVSSFAEGPENRLWVGTSSGLFLLDKDTKMILDHFSEDSQPDGLYNNYVSSVYEDNFGKIYVGLDRYGLEIIDLASRTIERLPYRSDRENRSRNYTNRTIRESYTQGQRIIWLTGNYGFFGYNPDDEMKLTHHYPANEVYPYEAYSWDLLPYDSCTIVSLHNNGMLWLDICMSAPNFRFWNTHLIAQPAFQIISAQKGKDGNVWAGSYGAGLFKVNFYNGDLTNYSLEQGLKSNFIYSILEDENENLWMSTNRGIERFNPETEVFTNFGFDDGLHIEEFSSGSFLKAKDGEMFFGGVNGFISFYPDSIEDQSSTFQPPVFITSFRISGEEVETDSVIYLTKEFKIPGYKAQHLEIGFSSLDYGQSEKNLYQYRLKNYDDSWSKPSTLGVAQFTQLSPGTYEFEVIGTNSDGIFSNRKGEIKIIIVPLWYQTKWFRIGGPIFIFLFVSLLIYLRIRRLRQEERLRLNSQITRVKQEALAAQMDHHFTFNSLNSIQRFIMDNNREAAIRFVSKFGKLIRKVLDQADKNYQTIEEEIETLELYLNLEKHRTGDSFQYHFDIDEEIDIYNTIIPTNLIQPYIENAIWHGLSPLEKREGKLVVKFRKEGDELICRIEDNGIGRKKAAELKRKTNLKHNSKGMRITSERIEALNFLDKAEISHQIIDLKNEKGEAMGTRVEIRMKLKDD